jgi:hypothetical protein
MSFDPKKHVIRVQGGREYLPASARLVWFRQEHPDWGIVTTPVEINLAPAPELKRPPYAIFQAQVFNAEGKLMATAHKYEDVKGFPDFLEKAETGAISRALSYCGFGTQFAPELEEGDRLADAPRGGGRFASAPARPMGGNGFGNRPGMGAPNGPMGAARPGMNGGGGGGRPGGGSGYGDDPRGDDEAPFEAEAPRVNARATGNVGSNHGGAGAEDDDIFSDDRAPAPAPRASAAPARSAPAAPPTPAPSGGITRVKEPEREYDDPGGADEFDDEEGDPFADDAAPAAPAPARAAAPARPAPAPVAAEQDDAPAAPPKPNKLAGNNCSVEGCRNVLTPGQLTVSMNKFGKALCMLHQKDPAVTGGAAAPAPAGGNRRPATREAQDALL